MTAKKRRGKYTTLLQSINVAGDERRESKRVSGNLCQKRPQIRVIYQMGNNANLRTGQK
jgi:hypothetical protein